MSNLNSVQVRRRSLTRPLKYDLFRTDIDVGHFKEEYTKTAKIPEKYLVKLVEVSMKDKIKNMKDRRRVLLSRDWAPVPSLLQHRFHNCDMLPKVAKGRADAEVAAEQNARKMNAVRHLEFSSRRELKTAGLSFIVTDILQYDKLREYQIKKVVDESATNNRIFIALGMMDSQIRIEAETGLFVMTPQDFRVIQDFLDADTPADVKRRTFLAEYREKIVSFDSISYRIKLFPESRYNFAHVRSLDLHEWTARQLANYQCPSFQSLSVGVLYSAFAHSFQTPNISKGWLQNIQTRVMELTNDRAMVEDVGECNFVDWSAHVLKVYPNPRKRLKKEPLFVLFGPFFEPFLPLGPESGNFYSESAGKSTFTPNMMPMKPRMAPGVQELQDGVMMQLQVQSLDVMPKMLTPVLSEHSASTVSTSQQLIRARQRGGTQMSMFNSSSLNLKRRQGTQSDENEIPLDENGDPLFLWDPKEDIPDLQRDALRQSRSRTAIDMRRDLASRSMSRNLRQLNQWGKNLSRWIGVFTPELKNSITDARPPEKALFGLAPRAEATLESGGAVEITHQTRASIPPGVTALKMDEIVDN